MHCATFQSARLLPERSQRREGPVCPGAGLHEQYYA
jgi:hypothetical protein